MANKAVGLIPDEKLVLKSELVRLRNIIMEKALELNALKASYGDKKKRYEEVDLSRAKKDGRFRIVEPKTDEIYKRKKGELSKLTNDQISQLISELEKLQNA